MSLATTSTTRSTGADALSMLSCGGSQDTISASALSACSARNTRTDGMSQSGATVSVTRLRPSLAARGRDARGRSGLAGVERRRAGAFGAGFAAAEPPPSRSRRP